ncbi:MAG: hypothetical protein NTY77_18735 [Elusimicrobia bacterium]|nr:hypothetical protein [Elusimicrobiota bacterium]
MKKGRVQQHLKREKLIHSLPHQLAEFAELVERGKGDYALVLFDCGMDETVHSNLVERALKKIPADSSQHIVVAGWNFTDEAFDAVSKRHGQILKVHDFPWTDERLKHVRAPLERKW